MEYIRYWLILFIIIISYMTFGRFIKRIKSIQIFYMWIKGVFSIYEQITKLSSDKFLKKIPRFWLLLLLPVKLELQSFLSDEEIDEIIDKVKIVKVEVKVGDN